MNKIFDSLIVYDVREIKFKEIIEQVSRIFLKEGNIGLSFCEDVKYLALGFINKKLIEPTRFKPTSVKQDPKINWKSRDFDNLSFSNVNITLEELILIIDLLKFNKSVKNIKLRALNLTDKHISNLFSKLGSNCSQCYYKQKCDNFYNCKECNSTVKKLDLMYNLLTDEACDIIRDYLMKNLALTSLSIGHNQEISINGLQKISFGLLVNHSLVHLDLQGLNIQDNHCKVINTILTFNRSIEKLDLSYNRIDINCILHLETGIIKNEILKELILCGNPLKDDGLIELAKYLKFKRSLRHLDLKSTKLTISCIKILKELKNIQKIDLQENYFIPPKEFG
jgi:hypothetical protein